MILTPITLSLAQLLALSTAPPAEAGPGSAPAVVAAPAEPSQTQQLQRARALASAGDREEALRIYSQVLEQSPGNFDARLARGRTYAWMDRWQEAEADLRAVVEHSPNHADAWSALGDMHLWSDRPVQATQAYTRWTELAPDDPAALIARGRAHRAAGNLDAARTDFEAARLRGGDALQVDRHLASLAPRVQNQEAVVPPGYQWSVRAGASRTTFSPERDAWNDQELALRRHFIRGSVALELLQAQRFGRHDTAWVLDAYTPLWQRAYANVRYQNGPGDGLLADQAWRVEFFQGVGRGWELSGSYDHLDFGSNTDMYGIGLGRYVGNFYARYKALYVAGSGSLSHRGMLRYYFAGNGDDYFEIDAGSGHSDEIGSGSFGGTVRRSNSSVGVAFVKYFHPQWGFKLSAGYAGDVDGFDERRVSASLYSRW